MTGPGRNSRFNLPTDIFRYRDYRYLWGGAFMAVLGTQMSTVAIAYHLFQMTNSVAMLGVLGLIRAVAVISTSIVGGMVVDARDRRNVLLTTQSSYVLLGLTLAALTWSGAINVPLLILIGGVMAIVASFDQPARQVVLPSLVPSDRLAQAMSLNMLSNAVGQMAGPALGGMAIYALGLAGTYAINAFAFLGTVAAVLAMHTRFPPPERRTSGIVALGEGLRFMRRSPVIYGVMLIDFWATLLATVNGLAPVFAEVVHNVGPRGLGLLYSAPAVGAIIGASMMGVIAQPRKPGMVVVWSVCAYGCFLALFGIAPSLIVALGCLAGAGFCNSVSATLRHTIRFMATPDALRGRIAGAHSALAAGGPRLGEFQAGITASLIGPQAAMFAGGSAVVAATLLIVRVIPAIRQYEYGPPAEADVAA